MRRRPFGPTGLEVTELAVGTGYWGREDVDGVAVTRAVLAGPVGVLDTSNNYGDGRAEHLIGSALDRSLPKGFLLQTKVDRDMATGDFSAARVRASAEESLARLGLERFPMLYLHDPETVGFDAAMAPGGAVEGLLALRDEGLADHIGVAGGPASEMERFVATGLFEALLTHSRWTLVDRTADALIDAAHSRGMGVMNGAVFGGGVLAQWPRRSGDYFYRPAPPELLAAVDAMGAACERHGVPLRAAAVQFSTRDRRIHSTVCGVTSTAQLDELVGCLDTDVPDALWAELEALCPPARVWLRD